MPIHAIEKEKIWEKVLSEIELTVSRPTFLTWFRHTSVLREENDTLIVNVPNLFAKEWLSTKYHKTLINILRNFLPNIRDIEYIISSQVVEKESVAKIPAKHKMIPHIEDGGQLEIEEVYIDKSANLNPRYTFDNFIVGSFNELAHAAALAVAKNIGSAYNPLFIYGNTGLGKTHLLQAIGNRIKQDRPNYKIQYLTSEKFANEYVSAIQNKEVSVFKERYRQHDLLIIDDVQFFSGRIKFQEEFFYLFNALYERNKQIVFSSDRSPKSIPELEDRLRSRLEGGMIADISTPELEARMAILKAKAAQKEIILPDEIIEYISQNIQSNIRELEGALQSVLAHSRLLGKDPSVEDAKEVLQKNIQVRKKTTMVHLIKTVADFYNISEKDIFEKTRKKQIVLPRQVAMYLLREDFNTSFPWIGAKFGGKDHTTVMHAYDKITKDIKENEKIKSDIKQIRDLLYKEDVYK